MALSGAPIQNHSSDTNLLSKANPSTLLHLPSPSFPQRDYSIPFALFDAKGKQVEPSGAVLTELLSLTLSVTTSGSQATGQDVTFSLKDPKKPLLGFVVNFSAACVNQEYNVSLVHPSPQALDVSGCLPGVTVTPVLYMLAVQEFTSKEEVRRRGWPCKLVVHLQHLRSNLLTHTHARTQSQVFLPDGAEVDADCGKR